MFVASDWKEYEVIDTGDGEKLERWKDIILRRPDPQAIWPKQQPELWNAGGRLVSPPARRAAANGNFSESCRSAGR